MSKTLAIVGMHRSGTSLLAHYVSACGIFIGADLLGKHQSNPAGHFEDREFLALHNAILTAHHLNHKVSSPVSWTIDGATLDRAKSLITARSKYPQWGWKDPRTCLFLPFWKNLLPECHFLITYRNYWPVIRSLISRDILMYRDRTSRLDRLRKHRYGQDEIKQLCNDYLRVWIWYNSEIITHLLEDPSVRYNLVSFDQLIRSEFGSVETLRDAGFSLRLPHQFNARLTKSETIKEISLVFDNALLQEADALEKRFETISMSMRNPRSGNAV